LRVSYTAVVGAEWCRSGLPEVDVFAGHVALAIVAFCDEVSTWCRLSWR
jgi:hypothetical protein